MGSNKAAVATAVLTGAGTILARAAATQSITQADPLRFDPLGQHMLGPNGVTNNDHLLLATGGVRRVKGAVERPASGGEEKRKFPACTGASDSGPFYDRFWHAIRSPRVNFLNTLEDGHNRLD